MYTRISTRTLAFGMLLAMSLQAHGASTDPSGATTALANAPLITNSSGSIMPNLFLVLDDSESMKWDFLPENSKAFEGGRYGVATSQCNGVYYNPTITYTPPVLSSLISLTGGTTTAGSPIITYNSNASPQLGQTVSGNGIPAGAYIIALSGTTQATLNVNATATAAALNFSIGSYPQASFTAAWKNGYDQVQGTVDLSTSFVDTNPVDRAADAAQTAFYYNYSGAQTTTAQRDFNNFTSIFWNECISPVGSPPGNTKFTKVVVSAITPTYTGSTARTDCATAPTCTFAEEKQNFANWYSYYHTRMMMMKSTTGLAFSSLSGNFRVGYSSINNNTGSDFLNLDQFTGAQKTAWYNKFYSATGGNSTPLREALANVGKMYANKLPLFNNVAVVDPIQFSCQQNFTILTTDGYWNGNAGSKLDGTPVGNQDGNVPRPQYDGTYIVRSSSQTTETDTQQVKSTSNIQKWTEQNQTRTSNLQSQTGTLQWGTTQQYMDSTLQWQTNLETTQKTLQWQTNLQHTDAPLQWRTNLQQTIQQQLWSTDQQISTAPLQWQTKQQITTAPLQWATNLQASTATLQKQTSQLQKQITQLQIRTSTLQQQTSQLQSRTSTLQGSTLYLQTRSSSDNGANWLPWQDTTSCTWKSASVDGNLRQCRYVTATSGSTLWSAAAGTWNNPAGCTSSYDATTAAGGTPADGTVLPGNGTSCRYTAWTGYANAASCTALAQSAGPNYTVATATQCQTIVTTAYHNVASCTANAVPDGAGQTTQCQYTAWSGWGGVAACAAQAQDPGPNYTHGTATQCQSVVTTAYGNAGNCTATTVPDASGNTTQCQYLAYTAWSTVISGTCTAAAQSASPNYTVGVATNCQTIAPATAYVATYPPTCAVSGTSDASGKVVTACGTAAYNTPVGVAANGICNGTLANVQCSTGTNNAPVYATYASPGCSINFNGAGGISTANASGTVVAACPVSGSWSPTTPLAAGQICAGGGNVQCSLGGVSTVYVGYAMASGGTCAVTYNGLAGTTTAGAGGNVVTACPTAAWNPPAAIAACNNSPHVQCSLGTGVTDYVPNYPPTCVVGTNNGTGLIVTACTLNAAMGPATNRGASNICTGGVQAAGTPTWGSTIQCVVGASLAPAYVTTYLPTCAITYNAGAGGTYTANASGNLVVACPTAAYSTIANSSTVGNVCDGTQANVKCIATAGSSTVRVTTYLPTCTVNFNAAGSSTAGTGGAAVGKVITACPTTTYGGGGNIGANNTCDGTLANVQCAISGGAAAYVTSYPPSCTATWNGATSTNVADASGKVRICSLAGVGGWTNTTVADGSCTPGGTIACRYVWGGWGNIGTCTDNYNPGPGYGGNILTGTQCQYNAWSGWANYAGAVCTPVPQPAASGSSTATARECQVVNANTAPANTPAWPSQAWLAAASCISNAPAFNGAGQRTNCQTLTAGPAPAATCTAGTLGVSPFTTTTCVTNTVTLSHGVASCTAGTGPGPNFITAACNTTTTAGVPDPTCAASAANAGNGWTATVCSAPTGGTFDTLADVAQYYWLTDLRDGTTLGNNLSAAPGYVGNDVSINDVPTSGADSATYQHMTTFTVGLGATGRMVFDPAYQSETATTPGDYYSVWQGLAANPPAVCSWELSPAVCNWPIPGVAGIPENIDDLWHAAVDGRGTYFSATNPADLANGLNSAFVEINKRTGSAAAATTSTAFVTQGDNFIFSSTYSTEEWSGELTRQQIDPATGAILSAIDWTAQGQLDLRNNTTRTIYTFDPTNAHNGGGTNKLKLFTYANLTATEQGYFDLPTLTPTLSQFCTVGASCLGLTAEANASGAPLVNFIAGDRTNEGDAATTKFYRLRKHLLGDIVDSEAVYIKKPSASYSDLGYATFKANNTNRQAMVYVGANDGMLHAFRATDDPATLLVDEGGQEDWAYIPRLVMPDLFRLADKQYGQNHRYYVDGTPVAADVCPTTPTTQCAGNQWKTILVGGLNGAGMLATGNNGGMGYYALDVTDPANPKALWEFSNANMGFTYGNPKVVKLADGTWVVLVTSGYDNTAGDGQGHLYVLNAYTGALIRDIATGVGTPASPSGLARIDAPVATPGVDATVTAVYGGDLEGNVWRFDVNGADTVNTPPVWTDIGAPGYDAQNLATLKDALGNAQPITVKPLITVASNNIVVNIGTGRYLGTNDKSTTGQDSFYAIKDTFPTTDAGGNPINPAVSIYGNPRTYTTPAPGMRPFVHQTFSSFTCPAGIPSICVAGSTVSTSSNLPVNFLLDPGWYTDFPLPGERDNTDSAIIQGTLVIATNRPTTGSCSFGGDSFVYQLDYRTGGAVTTAPNGIVGVLLGHELTSRPVVVMLQDGTSRIYTQGSSGGQPKVTDVIQNVSADGVARRTSWRELSVDK